MMRCLPARALALGACLCFAAACPAPSSAQDAAVHKLPSPAWAVEFGLANASLTSFDGATISLRQQKSAQAAWRYGLSVSAYTSKNDQDRTETLTQQTMNNESNSSSSDFTVSVTRLTFPTPDAVVRPWFAAGLEVGWSSSRFARHTDYYTSYGTFDGSVGIEERRYGPSVAVQGMFGLEWSATDRFAIHAQYGQAVRYRRLREQHDEHQIFENNSLVYHREGPITEWSTYAVSARAGVSVFW